MHHSDLPFFPLASARTHEVSGPGAHVFAFALAAHLRGDVMFVRGDWDQSRINPNGSADFVNVADLMICNTKSQTDALAVTEEALRSGALSLVTVALNKPLGLTEGRRLQLAARDGKCTGLAMIPQGMGSNAAETRWQCAPLFDASSSLGDSTLHRWELIKNKSGTLGVWHVRWDAASRRITMVSPAGE